MTDRACTVPGCQRAPRPDSPYCPDHFRAAVVGPVYRVRTRGRIEVRIEGGHWQRMGTIPKGGIRI